jgi:hypothetical protein
MFNGSLQTPVPIARTQFYGTVGGGLITTLSTQPAGDLTNIGTNIEAARRSISRAIRLRPDYRVFTPTATRGTHQCSGSTRD